LVSGPRVPLSVGFPPVADARARVLVLGSLPGVKSLEMREYYAQPHNAFWRIMGQVLGAGPELPYAERIAVLRERGVAVWDVLAAGEREGSLDSAIVQATIVVNDFEEFFARHALVRAICFNGNTAADLYRRKVLRKLVPPSATLATQVLPSTSPTYASLRFEQKLERWSAALRPLVVEP
jgi:TDG/mug DNA glycosylase family protein